MKKYVLAIAVAFGVGFGLSAYAAPLSSQSSDAGNRTADHTVQVAHGGSSGGGGQHGGSGNGGQWQGEAAAVSVGIGGPTAAATGAGGPAKITGVGDMAAVTAAIGATGVWVPAISTRIVGPRNVA